eukprot:1186066-Prorocentrum_minimum.AAC.2
MAKPPHPQPISSTWCAEVMPARRTISASLRSCRRTNWAERGRASARLARVDRYTYATCGTTRWSLPSALTSRKSYSDTVLQSYSDAVVQRHSTVTQWGSHLGGFQRHGPILAVGVDESLRGGVDGGGVHHSLV